MPRVEEADCGAFHEHLKHQPCRAADSFCATTVTPFDLKVAAENRAYLDAARRAELFARTMRPFTPVPTAPQTMGQGAWASPASRPALCPAKLGDVAPVRPAAPAADPDPIAMVLAMIAARKGRGMFDAVV